MVDLANYDVSGEYYGSGKSCDVNLFFWVNLTDLVDLEVLVNLMILVIL